MTSSFLRSAFLNFHPRKNAKNLESFRRLVIENLEARWVLSAEWIYYDYVQDDALQGGRVQVQENNPLHAMTHNASPAPPPYQSTTLINNGPSSNRIDLVIVGDGYTVGDLAAYVANVDNVVAAFFDETPLNEYASFFNVHRVDVISNESGVDNDPSPGINRDTALDAGFWCGNIERLLCVNVSKTIAAANNAPDVDQILVLANSSKYGGAGYGSSNIGTLSGNNASAIEIGLHEFGHSFADLADEYDYSDGATYTGPEPAAANVSTYDAATMNNLDAKWHLWLDEPNVSTFEGGMYNQYGIYRPTNNSKMRSLGRPFEQVNIEQFVLSGYRTVTPIDSTTPAGIYGPSTEFFVNPVNPVSHQLSVQWSLDGTPILGATGTTFSPAALGLPVGTYALSAKVVDNSGMVRDEAQRTSLLTEERSWTIEVSLALPEVIGTILNDGAANRSGVSKVALQFDQPVTVSTATALRLYNHTANSSVNLSTAPLLSNGTSLVAWDLASVILPAGRYTAELPATAAIGAGGPLNGTYAFEFAVVRGDMNGDAIVNFADYGVIGANFDPLPGTPFREGDANGDGTVTFADYGVVGANFNPIELPRLAYDFGDAPEDSTSFRTTIAGGGAQHVISGPSLGTTVDSEVDGQPSANADGDGADEDGVSIITMQAGQLTNFSLLASVTTTAFLNAWIDFNDDGDWDDEGEQIFNDQSIINGANALSFGVPASSAAGIVTARLRITEIGGYSHSGLAASGEVEDYRWAIAAPPPAYATAYPQLAPYLNEFLDANASVIDVDTMLGRNRGLRLTQFSVEETLIPDEGLHFVSRRIRHQL